MTHQRNTAAIVQHARDKSQHARARVRAAIHDLDRNDRALTFHAVARQAGVSTTFLYDPKHADLAAEIRQRHRARTVGDPTPFRGKSETAKDAQIARLQERVRILEVDVRTLRRENEHLWGRLATQGMPS